VIKFLVAEQCKPSEIFKRMSVVYEGACFNQKKFTNGLNYSRKDGKMFSMKTGQEDLRNENSNHDQVS